MTLDLFRPFFRVLIDPIASELEDLGVGPNSLSVASLFFAALAGVSLYFRFLFLAGLMVFLNAASDAMDGALARRIGTADLRGDFLDHVIDRYADIFIVCGIFFGGLCTLADRRCCDHRRVINELFGDTSTGCAYWEILRRHFGQG